MNRLLTSTTRSTGRKLALALLVLGLPASGLAAKAGSPDFTLAASPASQTVAQGTTASYTISLTRLNGFTGSVALSASNLPAGASAQFSPSSTISSTGSSVTLKIKTAAATPTGTYSPVVTGVGGNLTRTAKVTLVVASATQPNFALTASPATQTIVQSEETSFNIGVTRTGGFDGPVEASVSGLPQGATATWTPNSTIAPGSGGTTLRIDTTADVPPGTYPLTVTGRGIVNGSGVSRSAAMTLVISRNEGIRISGDAASAIDPGSSARLDLLVENPYKFDVRVQGITVSLREGTSRAGCSGSQNFSVKQMPSTRFPLTVPAGASMRLSELGVAPRDMPSLSMTDRPWNQDACRLATVYLGYEGTATK